MSEEASPEAAALVALHSVPGMTQAALRRILERFGTALRAIAEASPESLRRIQGLTGCTAEGVLACRGRLPWAERLVARLTAMDGRILHLGGPGYPQALVGAPSAPRVLYAAGDLGALGRPAVAIVGSTSPSAKGTALAEEFARRLARRDIAVVSGMAKGVDQAAHRGAASAEGVTIFVLPEGILRFRPGGDLPPRPVLLRRSLAISEVPPETEWSTQAAVARNRLIAALGRALIVVETRPKGGAMHTVRAALAMGRPVYAVRFSDPPPSAIGNDTVLGLGAQPLTRLADLAALIEALGR